MDTNVLVVANGRQTNADPECQLACVEALLAARAKSVVYLDTLNIVMNEYQPYVNFSGAPGVGDAFFIHLFNSQYLDDAVRRVAITPSENEETGYEELPRNALKGGDRAILAVAVVASAKILNATDSDWKEQEQLLKELRVKVGELCG